MLFIGLKQGMLLYMHLSGGAGVGKSVVIRASHQTLYRLLNLKEGENQGCFVHTPVRHIFSNEI